MFDFLNKLSKCEIYSPVKGICVPLEQVPDKVFANKMLGEGVAFVYETDTVHAPCDGKIIMIAKTKHAFGIRSKAGVEVLVHIGLDTVNLNGNGLESLVSVGDKVKAHSPIIRIDRNVMKENKINLISPMIITNSKDYNINIIEVNNVGLETVVIEANKR